MSAYFPRFLSKRPLGGFIFGGPSSGGGVLPTEEELLFLQSLIVPGIKIYEPVMEDGQLVLEENGDCLVDWGGEYAT